RHYGCVWLRLRRPLGEAGAVLSRTGARNRMNWVAGSGVATALKVKPELIADALSSVKPPKMRGEVLNFAAGFTVVDDSYNSNPRSLLSMTRTLAEASKNVKRRLVIAGEMLELGPEAPAMHREAGREIARLGIDVLWGVRGLAKGIVACAQEERLAATRFFESSDDATTA